MNNFSYDIFSYSDENITIITFNSLVITYYGNYSIIDVSDSDSGNATVYNCTFNDFSDVMYSLDQYGIETAHKEIIKKLPILTTENEKTPSTLDIKYSQNTI